MAKRGEPLTERETEILRLMATGVTNREIAYGLSISVNTVKVHVRNIFSKMGAESRTEATMIAVREGWVAVLGLAEAPRDEDRARLPAAPVVAAAPPLPWPERVLLLVATAVVAAVIAVTWPGARLQTDTRLDPPPDQAQGQPASARVESAESRWHERAQMPTRRAYLALAAVDGQILAIGGRTSDDVTGAVDMLTTVIATAIIAKPITVATAELVPLLLIRLYWPLLAR